MSGQHRMCGHQVSGQTRGQRGQMDNSQSPNIEQRAGPSFCSEEGRDTHCSRGGVLTNKRKQHNVTVETAEEGEEEVASFYSMAQNNGLRAPSASALSRIKQNNRNNFLVSNINSWRCSVQCCSRTVDMFSPSGGWFG